FTKAFSGFTREQLQFLIAEDLEVLLPELVYATQVVHEQGVLKAPPAQMKKRLEEAKGFNFKSYSEKIGVPTWRAQVGPPDGDLETFTRRGSLAAVPDKVRGNARVHFMHNADDFLADPTSLEELKQALGDQLKIYPYGGHLGNLWYPVNREDVLRLFRTPP